MSVKSNEMSLDNVVFLAHRAVVKVLFDNLDIAHLI